MAQLRGVLPLVLTGTTGLAVMGFGLTGLSGLDPRLEQAARTVQEQQVRPDVPDPAAVPDVPDGAVEAPRDRRPPAGSFRRVDCPPHHDRSRRAGEA